MTDIVERLRRGATSGVLIPCEDLIQAAEIIEQYRADAAYDECTINFLKAGSAAQAPVGCGVNCRDCGKPIDVAYILQHPRSCIVCDPEFGDPRDSRRPAQAVQVPVLDRSDEVYYEGYEQARSDLAQAHPIPLEATPEMVIAGELAGMKYMADAKVDALIRDVRPTITAEMYRAMVKCALTVPSADREGT